MKKYSRFKHSLKNVFLFSGLAIASVGLGVAGFVFGAGGIATIAISAISCGLGGIWTVAMGKSIAGAVKAKREESRLASYMPDEENIKDFNSSDRKSKKIAYSVGLNMREVAQTAVEEHYKDQIKQANYDLKLAKTDYKFSDKSPTDKAEYLKSQSERNKAITAARENREFALNAIPKKISGCKIARGFAITGAVLGTALSLATGYALYNQYNNADVMANENGATQQEFIDKGETIDNSLKMAESGLAMASTITAAVVAGYSVKRRKAEIAAFDYDKIISSDDELV